MLFLVITGGWAGGLRLNLCTVQHTVAGCDCIPLIPKCFISILGSPYIELNENAYFYHSNHNVNDYQIDIFGYIRFNNS